jgi:hypothetical protein
VAMEKRFSRRGALSAEDNKFLVAEVESLRIGLFFRVHYKGNWMSKVPWKKQVFK